MSLHGKSAITFAVLTSISTTTFAELIDTFEVGEGEFTSSALFQFENENQYLYQVSYSGTQTGRDLFDIIAEAQPDFFDAVIESYSFGDFLVGVTIGEDHDEGYGTPPEYLDYWHYWTIDDGSLNWTESMIGFTDRVVHDGSSDGWVFNSSIAPIPAAPVGFTLLGVIAKRRRRR